MSFAHDFGKFSRSNSYLSGSKSKLTTAMDNSRPGSPSNKIGSKNSGVTVSYFDIAGRGFAIRVALFNAFGKDGFTDDRISVDDWARRKSDAPLGSFPVLTMSDGTKMTQTDAILRWAATQNRVGSQRQMTPLYPSDPDRRFQIDEINTICGKILAWAQHKKYQLPTTEEQHKALHEYISKPHGDCWKAFNLIEKRLGDKKFVAGDDLSTADLGLVGLVSVLQDTDFLHPIPKEYIHENFPMLHAHFNRVFAHPLIKEFMMHFPKK